MNTSALLEELRSYERLGMIHAARLLRKRLKKQGIPVPPVKSQLRRELPLLQVKVDS